GRDARVVEEVRIDRTERRGAMRPDQTLLRMSRSRQRPAKRIGRADARSLRPSATAEDNATSRAAVVGLEQGEIDVGVDTIGLKQALLGADQGEILLRLRPAAGRQLCLAQAGDVLGEWQPRDGRPVLANR